MKRGMRTWRSGAVVYLATMACAASAGCDAGGSTRAAPTSATIDPCAAPSAPVLDHLHSGAVVRWLGGAAVETGTATDANAGAPDTWSRGDSWTAPTVTSAAEAVDVVVFARNTSCATGSATFRHRYRVVPVYAAGADQPETTAIAMDDPGIVGWASGVVEPVSYGADVDAEWRVPAEAIGPANGRAEDCLVLGNGGSAVLTFAPAITDGAGPDLAVFENGVNHTFLELAFVEVSSDGETFARFDNAYLGEDPVEQYGAHDPEEITGLAGKYKRGFGTPFDLALLRYHPAVQRGDIDLTRITHVRVVDIVGDGTAPDSFGHAIYDPTPSIGTGGFDLDAVAVLHAAQ